MLRRSYLYVPGDEGKLFVKAARSGADVVILDLEDAVSPERKQGALEEVSRWLEGDAPESTEWWVRVNSGERCADEIARLARSPGLRGVVLAKCESADQVEQAASTLVQGGRSDVALVPLLESAAAVLGALDIASHPRTYQLQLGEHDLGAELGVEPSTDPEVLSWVRSTVVLVSSARQLAAPPAPVSIELCDTSKFAASIRRAVGQGFVGAACVHPDQVRVVNGMFTPSPERVAWAEGVVGAFEAARASGGAVVALDGKMIDEAVVRSARRVLSSLGERSTQPNRHGES